MSAWIEGQRSDFRKGVLEHDRAERLAALPGWSWSPHADDWESGFSHLQRYIETHGDSRVPRSYKQDGFRLGSWAGKQRDKYRKGNLDKDKIERLEATPGWSWDPLSESWENGFAHLAAYVKQYGHARVPQAFLHDGFALGSWIASQRHRYRIGALEKDREQRLTELAGWTWNPHTDRWEEGYKKLLRYVELHGNADAPTSCVVDGYKLGAWLRNMRSGHVTMSDERRSKLEQLPGWTWDPYTTKWERAFQCLVEYTERTGSARTPNDLVVGDLKLGSWAKTQRQAHRRGELSSERTQRLEALPGWTWNPPRGAAARFG